MQDMAPIKQIVAQFTRLEPQQIDDTTRIDSGAVRGSLMARRMFAAIAAQLDRPLEDTGRIKTFADLRNQIQSVTERPRTAPATPQFEPSPTVGGAGIGIDIQKISVLPQTSDYRSESFYQATFSAAEISYCILQTEPVASFAGKFAAKEAVIKADARYSDMPLNQIEILNQADGQPQFADFAISVAHDADLAVAVAIAPNRYPPPSPEAAASAVNDRPATDAYRIAVTALVFALIAIALAFTGIFL